MSVYEIILKKRNGGALSAAEIEFVIRGAVTGEIPDYQLSALLMAIYFRGMTHEETVLLTRAMTHSGDTVDLSAFGNLTADKHSTGGVGDKTSLIVGPVAASLGLKIAKMTGRGLGHTGGTVDKLESIPGYRTALSGGEFIRQVETVGIALIGQTGNLTPADKKLYALRDVTATIDSIPLITSSIMCKKLAAGAKTIVLDVKTGSGAFMKTPDEAKELARAMVEIGRACGRNTAALITDMNTPLGKNVGNALEVIEAVQVLRGETQGDLYEVSAALAANMVSLVKDLPLAQAENEVREAIRSGAAFAKMKEWIAAQGGDRRYLENTALFPAAKFVIPVPSPATGFIRAMDVQKIGLVSVSLGAGRAKKEDAVDPAAGLVLEKKTGDPVRAGETIATLYTNKAGQAEALRQSYLAAVTIGDAPPEQTPVIYGVIR